MSSPEAKARKPSKTPPKKPVRAKAGAANGDLSDQDKAHFVKAMWEGIESKAKKPSGRKPAGQKTAKVEVLRKISAPPPVRQTEESAEATKLAAALEQKLSEGELDVLTPEALQALMVVLCKLYGANAEAGNRFPVIGQGGVTGTDAMITCGALLKAVDLQVFELGMWQSWSGM
jgi:hypothetical protein